MSFRFSILVNCFNGEQYLSNALGSIMAQEFRDYEIVFYDNCSADDSVGIASQLIGEKGKIIRASRHTSLYEARKIAMKFCEGEFITFLDVDDEWLPEYLTILNNAIELHPDKDIFLSNFFFRRSDNQLRRRRFYAENTSSFRIVFMNRCGILSTAYRRAFIEQFGITFSSEFQVIGDLVFLIRGLSVGGQVQVLNIETAICSIRDGSLSRQNDLLELKEKLRFLCNFSRSKCVWWFVVPLICSLPRVHARDIIQFLTTRRRS